jgi:hypothetical protein
LFGFRKKARKLPAKTNVRWNTVFIMKDKAVDSEKQKRPYTTPEVTELTLKRAEEIVKDRTNCSDLEAKEIVESLLRERAEQDQKAS